MSSVALLNMHSLYVGFLLLFSVQGFVPPTTTMATRHIDLPVTSRINIGTSSARSMTNNNSKQSNPFGQFSNSFTPKIKPESVNEKTAAAAAPPPKKAIKSKMTTTPLAFLNTLGLGVLKDDEESIRRIAPMKDESPPAASSSSSPNNNDAANKFDFRQRIESIKCAVVGALSGAIASAPISLLHTFPNIAQWEFSTDMAAIQGALFCIVYRYAIRKDDGNPMLNQGVLGAFVLTRTLSNIHVSPDCSAVPLICGPPLGYFDWNMINQGIVEGAESAALFGGAYLAMEYAFSKGWISKFD